ncbi:hypothetical protein Plhal304r1_c022g0077691 [Plasmopara halstedii]
MSAHLRVNSALFPFSKCEDILLQVGLITLVPRPISQLYRSKMNSFVCQLSRCRFSRQRS